MNFSGTLVPAVLLRRYQRFGWLWRLATPKDASPHSRQERLRLVLEELGPAFVKLGQVLSTRHDLLPAEYARELEKLQDTVAPFPGAAAFACDRDAGSGSRARR